MIGPAILLLGSYLALSPGVDFFLYPKLMAIFVGARLCLTPGPAPELRPYFLAVLAVAAASALAGASPLQSFLGLFRSPTAGFLGLAAAWAAYEAGYCRSTSDWWLITLGASVCSLVALAQLHPAAPWHVLVPSGRAIGPIGSPPFLGCMLALAIPLAAAREPRALLFIGPALLATRSKAGIIGAVAGMAVLVLLLFRNRINRRALLLWSALAILTACVVLNRGMSDVARIEIWRIAWRAFVARPLLGWGPDNFLDAFMQLRGLTWLEAGEHNGIGAAENAHNVVLNVLATQGLLGLAAHATLAWEAVRKLLLASEWFDDDSDILLASGAAVLAYSMFNPVPFMAWAVLAFMAGTMKI